jgi:hypothetical protein
MIFLSLSFYLHFIKILIHLIYPKIDLLVYLILLYTLSTFIISIILVCTGWWFNRSIIFGKLFLIIWTLIWTYFLRCYLTFTWLLFDSILRKHRLIYWLYLLLSQVLNILFYSTCSWTLYVHFTFILFCWWLLLFFTWPNNS